MNEKIYMPVEETNKMYEAERGLLLINKTLLLDSKTIRDKYKGKRLIPTTEPNSVGIMTVPLTGPKRMIRTIGYCVYMNDNDGNVEWTSKKYLNFSAALYLARNFYVGLWKAYYSKLGYVKDCTIKLVRGDYVKAYSEMTKGYDDKEDKYAKIRHRNR